MRTLVGSQVSFEFIIMTLNFTPGPLPVAFDVDRPVTIAREIPGTVVLHPGFHGHQSPHTG